MIYLIPKMHAYKGCTMALRSRWWCWKRGTRTWLTCNQIVWLKCPKGTWTHAIAMCSSIMHIYLDAFIIYMSCTKQCQGRSRCFATEICGRYKSRLRDESLSCPCKVMASNLDKYMHDYLNAFGLNNLYNQILHLYMCQGLGRSLKQRKRKLKKQRTVWRNRRQKRTRSERMKWNPSMIRMIRTKRNRSS